MKAQTEIFGLAIVVLLLSVGLLFAIGFMTKKEPSTIKKEFTQTEVGYNFLGVMLETTTDCDDLSVTELIKDCAENDVGSRRSCDYGNSCEHVEYLLQEFFLRKTLNKWGYNYNLTIQGADIDSISNHPCKGEKKASTYIVPTDVGNVNVKLYLCD